MPHYTKAFVNEMRALAIATQTCPQCIAPPGSRCLSKKPGHVRKTVHGPRFDLAMGRQPRDHTIDRRRVQPLWEA